MAGYGDFSDALTAGQNVAQSAQANYLHNQAINALAQAYGPIAGDPQAALQMQTYGFNQQNNPLLINQQQLHNTGMGLDNALSSGLLGPRIQGGQGDANTKTAAGNVALATQPSAIQQAQGNANTATGIGQQNLAKGAVDQATIGAGIQQAQGAAAQATGLGQTNQVAGAQAASFQDIRGAGAFSDAAEDALRQGQTNQQALDAGKKAAILAGEDPARLDQLAGDHGQTFLARPYDVIYGLRGAALNASRSYSSMPLTPQQQLELKKLGVTQQSQYLENLQSAQKAYGTAKGDEDAAVAKAGATGVLAQQTNSAQAALAQMRNMITSGEIPANGLARGFQEHFEQGSPMARYKALADQVGAALSIETFTNARAEAGGAVLRGTQNEFNAAGESAANFSTALGPAEQLAQINAAQAHIKAVQDAANMVMRSKVGDWDGIQARRQGTENVLNQTLSATPGSTVLPGGAQPAPALPAPGAPAQPAANTPAPGRTLLAYAHGTAPTNAAPDAPGLAQYAYRGVDTQHFTPEFSGKVSAGIAQAEKEGINVHISSGFRSPETQNQLYQNMLAHREGRPVPFPGQAVPAVAAPPGSSRHESGNAADIYTADPKQQDRLDAIMRAQGLTAGADFARPDQGHYEISGNPGREAAAQAQDVPARVTAAAPAMGGAQPPQQGPAQSSSSNLVGDANTLVGGPSSGAPAMSGAQPQTAIAQARAPAQPQEAPRIQPAAQASAEQPRTGLETPSAVPARGPAFERIVAGRELLAKYLTPPSQRP